MTTRNESIAAPASDDVGVLKALERARAAWLRREERCPRVPQPRRDARAAGAGRLKEGQDRGKGYELSRRSN